MSDSDPRGAGHPRPVECRAQPRPHPAIVHVCATRRAVPREHPRVPRTRVRAGAFHRRDRDEPRRRQERLARAGALDESGFWTVLTQATALSGKRGAEFSILIKPDLDFLAGDRPTCTDPDWSST